MSKPNHVHAYVIRIPVKLINQAICAGTHVTVPDLILGQLRPVLIADTVSTITQTKTELTITLTSKSK